MLHLKTSISSRQRRNISRIIIAIHDLGPFMRILILSKKVMVFNLLMTDSA